MRASLHKKKVTDAELEDSVVFSSIWKLDFPSMVPEWLYIQMCKYLIAYVLAVLRTKAKTMKGLPHADRIRDNPEVYGEIRRRLEAIQTSAD